MRRLFGQSKPERVAFHTWLNKFPYDDLEFGELRYEIELDRNFPRSGPRDAMRAFLTKRADRDLLRAFDRAYQLWLDGG